MPATGLNPITGLVLTLLLVFGIWAAARGWTGMRNPTSMRGLGLGWYVGLSRALVPRAQRHRIEALYREPRIVRSFAIAELAVGIFMVLVFVVVMPVLLAAGYGPGG